MTANQAALDPRDHVVQFYDCADVLVGALHLDFAFVRLCDPAGGAVVDAVRGQAWPAFPEWLQRRLTVGGPLVRREIVWRVAVRGSGPAPVDDNYPSE